MTVRALRAARQSRVVGAKDRYWAGLNRSPMPKPDQRTCRPAQPTPTVPSSRCTSHAPAFDYFGESLAVSGNRVVVVQTRASLIYGSQMCSLAIGRRLCGAHPSAAPIPPRRISARQWRYWDPRRVGAHMMASRVWRLGVTSCTISAPGAAGAARLSSLSHLRRRQLRQFCRSFDQLRVVERLGTIR